MMSDQDNTVTVTIMDKTFKVKCPQEHISDLRESARFLDEKMKEVSQNSKILSIDRIAVIAALNIAHELLLQKNDNLNCIDQMSKRLETINYKIEQALDA